jgi:hypothetical protein
MGYLDSGVTTPVPSLGLFRHGTDKRYNSVCQLDECFAGRFSLSLGNRLREIHITGRFLC